MKKIYLFFFFLLLNLTFCEECTEKDYGATFTECDQNIRQGAFYWYEPKTCTGGVSLPDSFQDLDCECTLQDYKITYLQCVNETRTKVYVKDTDCVDGDDPPLQEKVACECTTNDYEAIYSDCLSESRDVNYFWKTPKKCVGGVELPERIVDLPCDIYCGQGTYLPIGKTVCQDCEAGSYSIGSGEHYYDWDEWPTSKFTTYCKKKESSSNANYFRILNKNRIEDLNLHANVIEPLEGIMDIDLGDESESDDCKGWQLGGTFIYSGNNGTSLSNSTLEYWEHFITDDDNSIAFTYQVEGEKTFDGLYFMIDDEIKLGLISSQVEPQNVTFEVTKGLHKFKWIYVKDVSVDVGNDNAVITDITVRGNKWANSECIDCKAGWFSTEGSPKCSECERNTYTDQEGMSECLDCNATQYSNPGSPKCIERKPCTDSDYEPYFSDCDANHKRVQYWRLIEPSICLEQDPPANNTDQPCKVCDPGQIEVEREKDGETIYVCDFCPEGKYRESINDDNVCVANPEGTYSPKSRYFHNLESFPEEFTTNCEGECGTSGWRLADDHLDSGEGHLGKATSSLNYKFELENLGYLKLDFEQDCEYSSNIWYLAKCGTIIYLDGYYVGGYLGSQERQTYDLTIYDLGEHEITIQFFKRYESETDTESNGDNIKLYELVIEGLTEGGAYNYHNCSEGSYSLGTNSNCTLCEPGTYSGEEGSAECLECPENTFSRKYGSYKCKECGSGTSSIQGATECDNNNCVFKFGEDRVYDISKLADPNKMEGPISTNTINEFYINLCYYNTSTAYCLDEVEGALITRGCQKNINYNYSLDIGDTIDVMELNSDDAAAASLKSNGRRFDDSGIEYGKSNPHDGINLSTSSNEQGLIYRLMNGDEGCGGERYTNITLICDISKDKGEIEPVGDIENPSYSCHYEFIWRSQYACRQCLERDYNHYYSNCKNKTRTKIYYWVKNPRECYGGVPLPEDETVECDSLLTCPSGTYSDGKNCSECIEGRYSSGNDEYLEGELLNDISDSESEKATFQTGCTGKGCTPFAFDSNIIKSGTGTTSWLKLEKEFSVNDGDKKVGFLFNEFLINEDSDDYLEKFSFIIDGIEVFSHSAKSYIQHEFQQIEFSINSTGIHEFTWMVYNINNINRGMHIKQISTTNSDLSKSTCSDCGFGFFANSTKSDVCKMCPQNTYSDNYGAVVCQSCSGDDYSYKGSKQCQPKVECTDQDWYIEYQDCDPKNRKRIGYYKFYEPKTCIGDLPSNNEIVEDCLPCYPGSFLNPTTNLCEMCPDGSYSDQINSEQCHQSEAGHAAIKTINWVSFESSNANTENLQFTTKCTGRGCGFSQGWRLRGDYLDSGVGRINDQQMLNSILQIESEIEIVNENGYLEFTTKFDNPKANLYVLINEQLRLELSEPVLDWETQHITLQPGEIEIAFIYIQDENPNFNTTDDKGLAYLKDIKFFGTLSGSATQQVPCSNGYYSSNPGLVECQICQPGTYSSTKPEGNSECISCPKNQYNTESGSRDCFTCGEGTSGNKESGSTECVNTCAYSVDEKTKFDFSEINNKLSVQRLFNQDAGDYIYFDLCSKIDDTEYCNDEESFVCKNKTSYGKILSFSYPLPAEKYPNSNGLMVEYLPQVHLPKSDANDNHDHNSRHSSIINEEEEGHSKTVLYMVCDQKAGIGEPTITNTTSSSNNEIVLIEMEWKSLYACRLCQMPDDFKQINGACENGESTIHYEQISSDCWNNLDDSDESVACKEVQLKQYIIYGSMGAIGLAAIGLMLVCWQKRKLKHKYTRIEKQNRTTDNGLFGENEGVVIDDDDDIVIQNDDKSDDEKKENQNDSSNKDIVRIENSSDNDNVPLFSSSEKEN